MDFSDIPENIFSQPDNLQEESKSDDEYKYPEEEINNLLQMVKDTNLLYKTLDKDNDDSVSDPDRTTPSDIDQQLSQHISESEFLMLVQRTIHLLLGSSPYPIRQAYIRENLFLSPKQSRIRGIMKMIIAKARHHLEEYWGLRIIEFYPNEALQSSSNPYYVLAQKYCHSEIKTKDEHEIRGFLLFLYAELMGGRREITLDDLLDHLQLVHREDLTKDFDGEQLLSILRSKEYSSGIDVLYHDEERTLYYYLGKLYFQKYIDIYRRQITDENCLSPPICIAATPRLYAEMNNEIWAEESQKNFEIEIKLSSD